MNVHARIETSKISEIVPIRLLRVKRDDQGRWQLSDSFSKIGGTFLTARAAVQFVRLESGDLLVIIDGEADHHRPT